LKHSQELGVRKEHGNAEIFQQCDAGLVTMTGENGGKSGPSGATKGKGMRSVQLSREIQAQLGNQLRQMYNDVVSQGVPDKFVDLLAKLEKADDGDSEESPQ
jgi:hypothetical protein